jgi:hypothetical protein
MFLGIHNNFMPQFQGWILIHCQDDTKEPLGEGRALGNAVCMGSCSRSKDFGDVCSALFTGVVGVGIAVGPPR